MRIMTIILFSILTTTLCIPAHAQYFGGLPLDAVSATQPADANNLLFGPRFFSVVSASENGAGDVKFGYIFSSNLVPHIALVGQALRHDDATRWNRQRLLFEPSQSAQRSNSYSLDLIGALPIFERFAVTGNAGLARVRASSVFGGAAPIELLGSNAGSYTSVARVGLGVQYDFNRSLGFRFGVERYRNLNSNNFANPDLDGDVFSFGIRIRF